MIAQLADRQTTPGRSDSCGAPWHSDFLAMVPRIEQHARIAFRCLNPSEREDAISEVIANSLLAYVRLVERGRAEQATWSSLARYAICHFRAGRRVGAKLNVRDVCSPACRSRKGVRVERLDRYDEQHGAWHELLVEDRTCTPSELAASRIDFDTFLNSLSHRNRRIAETLASGESTSEVGQIFQLSKARVSQLRSELLRAWQDFQGENARLEPAWR